MKPYGKTMRKVYSLFPSLTYVIPHNSGSSGLQIVKQCGFVSHVQGQPHPKGQVDGVLNCILIPGREERLNPNSQLGQWKMSMLRQRHDDLYHIGVCLGGRPGQELRFSDHAELQTAHLIMIVREVSLISAKVILASVLPPEDLQQDDFSVLVQKLTEGRV